MLTILDRYVLRTWISIFIGTALGFPLISILINLTDNLSRLLGRGLTAKEILVSYIYSVPENMFIVLPAAVLFATVFTVGGMGRHSEITAAKAGGQSFYRLCFPIFVAALLAAGLGVVVGELAPVSTSRQLEVQKAREARPRKFRYNFVYRGDDGWVYTVRTLDVGSRIMRQVVLERQGLGKEYPGLAIAADSATYDSLSGYWMLHHGTSRRVIGPGESELFAFDRLRLHTLRELPADLLAENKAPNEMRYAELGRYISALRRSGNDVSKLEVDQALKIAVPATCFVIAIFAAPLALSAPRSGAAVGIGIGLGTTLIFLLVLELSKAVGASGLVQPLVAAWLPEAVFLTAGLWAMLRART
ncbi:MAG TPA: LptF/LptG family permease [Gemmatimonadales bacterium]|nr:LptF/LptG family permease [Gemmatimonadales bacterium]